MTLFALTLTEFECNFPAFKAWVQKYPNEVTAALDAAWRRINAPRFGQRASDAHGYLAAHLLTANPPDGSGGTAPQTVVSVGAGSSRVQYSQVAATDDDLKSSRWGKQYTALVKLTGGFTLVNGAGLI